MATAAASNDRLGDILIREGLITREQLSAALSEQKSTGHRLGYVLVKLGLVQELEVTKVLARQYRMPAVDLSRFEVDPKILKMVPGDFALKHILLPLKREGRTLTVAMADPTNTGVLDDLKFITRYDLFPVIAGECPGGAAASKTGTAARAGCAASRVRRGEGCKAAIKFEQAPDCGMGAGASRRSRG